MSWVVSILSLFGSLAAFAIPLLLFRLQRQAKAVSKHETSKLWSMLVNPKYDLISTSIINELVKRQEDMAPAIAPLGRLMLSKHFVLRLMGHNNLKTLFPDLLADIDYDYRRPTAQHKKFVEELVAEATRFTP